MDLKNYIQDEMRMSHIYQPVMIWTLLNCGGRATRKEIAREIAGYDQPCSIIEERVKKWQVLTKNKVTIRPNGTNRVLN